ncbi:hypothetical protein DFP72DRAFT_779410, partial [Ephemerocybe angulata]
ELELDDISLLRVWSWKTKHNITDSAFDDLDFVFPDSVSSGKLPKAKAARRRIEFLAKFKATYEECCINSCLNYVGANEGLDKCPYCKELRWTGNKKPRKVWKPISIIPQLRALYLNPDMTEKMKYRHDFVPKEGVIQDVYDGLVYAALREKDVVVGEVPQDYKFFCQETDVALGFSTDGFGPFKTRLQTC